MHRAFKSSVITTCHAHVQEETIDLELEILNSKLPINKDIPSGFTKVANSAINSKRDMHVKANAQSTVLRMYYKLKGRIEFKFYKNQIYPMDAQEENKETLTTTKEQLGIVPSLVPSGYTTSDMEIMRDGTSVYHKYGMVYTNNYRQCIVSRGFTNGKKDSQLAKFILPEFERVVIHKDTILERRELEISLQETINSDHLHYSTSPISGDTEFSETSSFTHTARFRY